MPDQLRCLRFGLIVQGKHKRLCAVLEQAHDRPDIRYDNQAPPAAKLSVGFFVALPAKHPQPVRDPTTLPASQVPATAMDFKDSMTLADL
jgi:hypothetical protein